MNKERHLLLTIIINSTLLTKQSLSLLKMKHFNMLSEQISFHEQEIIGRNKHAGQLLSKLLDLDSDKLDSYLDSVSKFGLNSEDYFHDFLVLACHLALAQSEMLKKFLKAILKPEITLDGKRVSNINTYGELFGKLTKQLNYSVLENFQTYSIRSLETL